MYSIDRTTREWHTLEQQLLERLTTLRLQNDNPSLSPEQTGAIRGSITEIKLLLLVRPELMSLPSYGALQEGTS